MRGRRTGGQGGAAGGAGRGFRSGAGISADDVAGGGPDEMILRSTGCPAITALPRPVVAVVHGPAVGVGVSIALAGDIVLASDQAFFMLAFTKIGLMPDGGASALVAAAIGGSGRRAWRCWPSGCRPRGVAPGGWLPRSIPPTISRPRSTRGYRVARGPGGGVRQDQERDQRSHLDRAGFRLGERELHGHRVCCDHPINRGRNGFPAAPHSQIHRPLSRRCRTSAAAPAP